MAAVAESLSGIGTVELAATQQQLTALSSSCLNFSFNISSGKLTVQQKSDLKTTLKNLRAKLVESVDLLSQRRGRIKDRGIELQQEINDLGQANQDVSNLFRLMANAIASCPDAAFAAGQIKSNSDRVLSQSTELTYRLYLTQVQQSTIAGEISEAQDALGVLDRVNLTLG